MRDVWSPLQRVWQQKSYFPIIVMDLVDGYGSSASISIRWAEVVPGNTHKFLRVQDLLVQRNFQTNKENVRILIELFSLKYRSIIGSRLWALSLNA